MAIVTRERALDPEKAGEPSTPSQAPTGGRGPRFDTLFTLIFALLGWAVGIERLHDNSFFWHLRTGELILDHGLPHHDPYSFTAHGTPWVVQSWLAEVLYGAVHRLAGAFGVRVGGALIGAAIAVLVFRLALRLTQERVRAALLSLAALGGLYTLWSVRPLVIGVLFFVIVLWIVEVPDSWVGRRPLLALPVVFWLWANVHGSFALGFAYLGLHVVGQWLDGKRPTEGRERTLVIGTLIALVVTFANPYGIALVTFPIDLLSRGEVLRDVVEWMSPNFRNIRGQSFALWIAVFAIVLARARIRPSRRDLVVTVPFLLLALWALRNVAVAPIVGLPVAARLVAVPTRTRSAAPAPRIGRVFAAVIGVLLVLVTVHAAGQPDYRLNSYPVAALHAIDEQGLLGRRLVTDDADAGLVILKYGPKQRVFFDDRFDMYPVPLFKDFKALSDVSPGWRRVLDEHDIEVVLWNRKAPLSQAMRLDHDWNVVYRDAKSIVFVRDGVTP
jgi:hypothetical protein